MGLTHHAKYVNVYSFWQVSVDLIKLNSEGIYFSLHICIIFSDAFDLAEAVFCQKL